MPQEQLIWSTASAIARFMDMVETQNEPVFDLYKLERTLERYQLAFEWSAETPHQVNDRVQIYPIDSRAQVVPTVSNDAYWRTYAPSPFGVYFRALTGGVSGTDQPDWCQHGFVLSQYGLSDGGVFWQYDGMALRDRWDFQAAAYDVWMQKAALASGKYDFSRADQKLSRSQIYDHCIQMAKSFSGGSFFVL